MTNLSGGPFGPEDMPGKRGADRDAPAGLRDRDHSYSCSRMRVVGERTRAGPLSCLPYRERGGVRGATPLNSRVAEARTANGRLIRLRSTAEMTCRGSENGWVITPVIRARVGSSSSLRRSRGGMPASRSRLPEVAGTCNGPGPWPRGGTEPCSSFPPRKTRHVIEAHGRDAVCYRRPVADAVHVGRRGSKMDHAAAGLPCVGKCPKAF
jgi:hypothetical protein